MKIILLSLLFVSSVAFSQPVKNKYYGSFGFGFGFFNSDALNRIINQFNSSPNVNPKMKEFGTLFGPNAFIGVKFDKEKSFFNFEFGFAMLFTGTKTSFIKQANRTKNEQDVQMRAPLLTFGANYFFKLNEMFHFGFGVGLNLGSLNILSRNFVRFTPTPDYDYISENQIFSYAAMTPALILNINLSKKFGISLRPNYFFTLKGQDFTQLNQELNPGVKLTNIQNSTLSGPGFAVNFMFKIGK